MAKRITGEVVSISMKDTVVVRVEMRKQHPVYKKVIKRHRKFFAHVSGEKPALGSVVSIVEIKPVSRHTHFKVEKIISQK